MGDNNCATISNNISYNLKDEVGLSEKSKDDPPEGTSNFKEINFVCFRASINKDTLPLKVTLFLYFGAMAAILPYLTIHMLSIGISISETAIIYGVLPFTSFIGPPLIGFLADKLGQYKAVLIIATFSNAFFHTMLLAVPTYREINIDGNIHLQWSPASNQVWLTPALDDHCDAFMKHFTESNTQALTNTQLSWCSEGEEPYVERPPENLEEIKFDADKTFSNETDQFQSHYIAGEFCRLDKAKNGLLEFICTGDNDGIGIDAEPEKDQDYSPIDVALYIEKLRNCSVQVKSPFGDILNATVVSCHTDILFDTGIILVKGNNAVTFWAYFLIRIIATIFMSSCFSLLDATTLAIVKKNNTEYGTERIWTVLGTAAISPVAGLLVDCFSRDMPETDFSAAFYVSDALFFLNILSYFVIKLDVDKPEKNFLKDGKKLFKYPEVVVFLIMIFIMGNMWGFVESYLFVFLKDELHAPNYLLGLTLTTGSLTGIPFLYGAEKIVGKIGRVNVIVIAFVTYFIRFIGYSYVWSPWWCFPFEALEAFTYHLMWTAAATYCSVLAPKGLLATLMGIMGALHYSLGKGFGSFLGGYLIEIVHVRQAFRNFGIASGIFGLIYFIMNSCWLKKSIKRRNFQLGVGGLSEVIQVEKGATIIKKTVDANANKSRKGPPVDVHDSEAAEAMLSPKNRS